MKRGWKILLNFMMILMLLFSLQAQSATAIPETNSLFYLGIENIKNHQYQQALSNFTQVIKLKGKLISAAYSNRCLINLQLGNNQAAKSDCTTALTLNSNNVETYLNEGLAEYRLGNYPEAINQYQEVIERNKYDYRAYYNQGLAYFALANYEKAVENYEQALLSSDSSSASVQALIYTDKGLTYFRLGNHQQAITDLNEAIRLSPDNEKAYYHRGCVYSKIGDYRAALTDLTQALQLNYQFSEAYLHRGWIHHQIGLEQVALEDFNLALQQFEQQGNTTAYQQTQALIEQLHQILAQSNRSLVS
ncbi:TPR repeat-containing protein [Gloeothece citriformis PCC 7424]|uniref:TPR repeat-containing protein n=1 Tax=Gloeothece citriformis (strain PCC 7424) TaxID=65393 RepID=B7K721_GLOC7|nr:tetratricopeptide repeat protein [Gloeothece citriformis]ACK72720.1 TPR repeat-containing protein [Gloeothece citriformis PCC 7424]